MKFYALVYAKQP